MTSMLFQILQFTRFPCLFLNDTVSRSDYIASNCLVINLLTGHDVYVRGHIALFQWVRRTITSSILHD